MSSAHSNIYAINNFDKSSLNNSDETSHTRDSSHMYIELNDSIDRTTDYEVPKRLEHLPNEMVTQERATSNFRFSVRVFAICCLAVVISVITTGIATYYATKGTNSVQYNSDSTDDGSHCSWTTWSKWTPCAATCGISASYRVKQYTGNCSGGTVMESRDCNLSPCANPGSNEEGQLKFNTSTLYKFWYISNDEKTLSNVYTLETTNSPDGTFKNYSGVSAHTCVGSGERLYYEIEYYYKVIDTGSGRWLLFEVGLAEFNRIDISHDVSGSRVGGWSFSAYNGSNSVTLDAGHNGHFYKEELLSAITVGTEKSGKFGAFVDRLNNKFTLIKGSSIFYTFQGVVSAVDLCPVFGVYNPNIVHVKLTILKSKNFTDYPQFSPQ